MDAESENVEVINESKLTSTVWQHFEIVSKKDFIAKCNYCERPLSYRTTVTNLRKHLVRKHDDMIVKISDDEEDKTVEEITYLEEDDEEDADLSIDRRRILRSGVWEYFEITDDEERLATCTLCREQFSYRTTSTNLAKHLRRRHCIQFEKENDVDYSPEKNDVEESDDSNDSGDNNDTLTKNSRRTSAAWKYFTVKDAKKRTATCNICRSQCSYLSSVSNLLKHVRSKHTSYYEKTDENAHEDNDLCVTSEGGGNQRSSVWLYFRCIDNAAKVAMCLICKKQLSHLTSITNLKKHLSRKHPRVQLEPTEKVNDKKMLLSSDGQLYEIEETSAKQERTEPDDDHDQTEPLEMNAIYLDDYEGEVVERKRKRKSSLSKRRKRTYLDETTGVAETISSDDEITFQKRYVRKKTDSLDKFGKYLVALLKQLPRELSNQLQADFVKQVMTAQPSDSRAASGYAITITEPSVSDQTHVSVSVAPHVSVDAHAQVIEQGLTYNNT